MLTNRIAHVAGLYTQILVNRGLLLLSKNDFVSAQENFEEAAAVAAAALSAKQKQPQNTDGKGKIFVLFSCGVVILYTL